MKGGKGFLISTMPRGRLILYIYVNIKMPTDTNLNQYGNRGIKLDLKTTITFECLPILFRVLMLDYMIVLNFDLRYSVFKLCR